MSAFARPSPSSPASPRPTSPAPTSGPSPFPAAGATIPLTARDYRTTFTLPNFYFHIATAYDILRHNGVPLGKQDYLRIGAEL